MPRSGAVEEMLGDLGAAPPARADDRRAGALPFIAVLMVHGVIHQVPLFLASFAGFAAGPVGDRGYAEDARLALHEARVEYAEYYFLFPLFLSITLLTQAGFFERNSGPAPAGDRRVGHGHVACPVPGLHLSLGDPRQQRRRRLRVPRHARPRGGGPHLFAMAQIAGYAVGGCWTHIGCAQSVVAYAFIRRDVDEAYTPVAWIKEMTPVILEMFALITVMIAIESWLF